MSTWVGLGVGLGVGVGVGAAAAVDSHEHLTRLGAGREAGDMWEMRLEGDGWEMGGRWVRDGWEIQRRYVGVPLLGIVCAVGGERLEHALRLGDQRREVTEERGVRRGADHLTAWPSMAKRTRHGQAH